MKAIIPPFPRDALKAELNPKTLLRTSNKAGNELYIVGPEAVNVIREIGRLREIAFRNDGGGTGDALDIDKFDTDPAYGYKQLVLWDPDAEEIIGGYRFCLCSDCVYDKDGQPILTSSHMFRFSRRFVKEFIPHTIELGRSFVSIDYQSSKAGAKSLFALDNLFDGLVALGILYQKDFRYFFGKATIYPDYPQEAREFIMVFLHKYFGNEKRLLSIRKEVKVNNKRRYAKYFKGLDFKEGYRVLKAEVTRLGVFIPPLINTYMNLSPSMLYFGTGINDEFGDVFDSGMLIDFENLYPEKRKRHADSFLQQGLQEVRKILKRFQRKK